MKLLVALVVAAACVYFGVAYTLKSPGFYAYIYSRPDISPKFCYYYGTILDQAGRPEAAKSFYDIVISTYADTEYGPLALVSLADMRDAELRRPEALELYRKFVETYPNHPKVARVNKNIEIILSR